MSKTLSSPSPEMVATLLVTWMEARDSKVCKTSELNEFYRQHRQVPPGYLRGRMNELVALSGDRLETVPDRRDGVGMIKLVDKGGHSGVEDDDGWLPASGTNKNKSISNIIPPKQKIDHDKEGRHPLPSRTTTTAATIKPMLRDPKAIEKAIKDWGWIDVVALDVRGDVRGMGGRLSVLQLMNRRGETILIDLLDRTLSIAALLRTCGVRALLENERIVKIMFNCNSAVRALYYHCGNIRLVNVFDVMYSRVAIMLPQQMSTIRATFTSLLVSLEMLGLHPIKLTIPLSASWFDRPLSEIQHAYMNESVCHLIPAYDYLVDEANGDELKLGTAFLISQDIADEASIHEEDVPSQRKSVSAAPSVPTPTATTTTTNVADVSLSQYTLLTTRGPQRRVFADGDWLCAKCNFQNFYRNTSCHKCRANRTETISEKDLNRLVDDRRRLISKELIDMGLSGNHCYKLFVHGECTMVACNKSHIAPATYVASKTPTTAAAAAAAATTASVRSTTKPKPTSTSPTSFPSSPPGNSNNNNNNGIADEERLLRLALEESMREENERQAVLAAVAQADAEEKLMAAKTASSSSTNLNYSYVMPNVDTNITDPLCVNIYRLFQSFQAFVIEISHIERIASAARDCGAINELNPRELRIASFTKALDKAGFSAVERSQIVNYLTKLN